MQFGLFWVAMAPFGLKTGASGPKSCSGPVFQNPGPDFGLILYEPGPLGPLYAGRALPLVPDTFSWRELRIQLAEAKDIPVLLSELSLHENPTCSQAQKSSREWSLAMVPSPGRQNQQKTQKFVGPKKVRHGSA